MSTTSNGSNILAAVGGISLTACVLGVRLVGTLAGMSHAHAQPPNVPHTVAATQTTSNISHATTFSVATPPAVATQDVATTDPTYTAPPAAPTAPAPTQASDRTETSGNQVTFISAYRLSYPTDWTVNQAGQEYGVLAPDNNAGVEVSVESSSVLDISGLETELVAKLPGFLQQYGGTADTTPQFQTATVDGVPAAVGTLAVTKNGQAGLVSASALYTGGHVYFVVGVIADQSADTATQDDTQVATIMDSFHLR